MKNFEPARSAAPALGCLRRRSALSNTGILGDGSHGGREMPIGPTARAGGHFADTRPGSVRRVARLTSPAGRRRGRRVTLRPTHTPAPSLRRRLLPAAATCMRTARRPSRRSSHRVPHQKLSRWGANHVSATADAPALRRQFPRKDSHSVHVITSRARADPERRAASPVGPPTNPL